MHENCYRIYRPTQEQINTYLLANLIHASTACEVKHRFGATI